jgi:hypothetical protein
MHLASADGGFVAALRSALQRRIAPAAPTLESAMAQCIDVVHASLASAVVLARGFAVVPYDRLPAAEREVAAERAAKAGHILAHDAPVVVLLATRGEKPRWNDRHASRDHLAVPLASPASVESIPMIASLLRQLGAEVRPAPDGSAQLVWQGAGAIKLGTFYVFDARTRLDARGQLIIPERSFVQEHDVRTVLGVGGTLPGGTLFAIILFARQHVTRSVAELLVPMAEDFASLARQAVEDGRLFEPDGP